MIKLPSIMRILRKNIWNIYPTELELKKENQINKNSNFLDLGIKIQNSRFQQKFTIKETILILIQLGFHMNQTFCIRCLT